MRDYTIATEQEVRDWLDIQIGAMKAQNLRLVLTEKENTLFSMLEDEESKEPDIKLINCSANNYIQLYAPGFMYVAKLIGAPITCSRRSDEPEYAWDCTFDYHNATFFCILTEDQYNEYSKSETEG